MNHDDKTLGGELLGDFKKAIKLGLRELLKEGEKLIQEGQVSLDDYLAQKTTGLDPYILHEQSARQLDFVSGEVFVALQEEDLKEIYTEGIIRISVYRAGDNQLFIRVEELDAGNIWMCFKYTDWDVEENNGRFKNLNDYIDDFVRKKENVKSVKKISIDTIEIVWYDAEFKGYTRSKCQFCVTTDLIGSVTLDMDIVRKNDVDKE